MKLRLKQLRIEQNLTQEQAGKIIFVNQSMYSRYESGNLELPLDALVAYADYYNVSVDYLMGLTDVSIPYASFNDSIN